jgi:hypothetical protein
MRKDSIPQSEPITKMQTRQQQGKSVFVQKVAKDHEEW